MVESVVRADDPASSCSMVYKTILQVSSVHKQLEKREICHSLTHSITLI